MTFGSGDGQNEIFFWSSIPICHTRTKFFLGWLGVVGQMFYTSPFTFYLQQYILLLMQVSGSLLS